MLYFGDDMSVTEVGDWYYDKGAAWRGAFGYSKTTSDQTPDGILHSIAGGLRTPFSDPNNPVPLPTKKIDLGVKKQMEKDGPYLASNRRAWIEAEVKEVLPTFTPSYGRSTNGIWGLGNAKTYNNVIRLIFYHGTDDAQPISCATSIKKTDPKYSDVYRESPPGYRRYAWELYMAPGIGPVQETFLYAEDGGYWGVPNCSLGLLFQDYQGPGNGNFSYIDEGNTKSRCTWNGASMQSGSSTIAYQAPFVPAGQSCVSQTRTCNNGVLSGSYIAPTCSSRPLTNRPPFITQITGPANVFLGQENEWTIHTFDPENDALSYQIYWGDGLGKPTPPVDQPLSVSPTLKYTYTKLGTFSFGATAKDTKGATTTSYFQVTVSPNTTCTNPPPQVVTNTCQEVGYPSNYTGSYISTRQLDCKTNTYSAWTRNNTCKLPSL